jgi:predicted metal-binding membrane protein
VATLPASLPDVEALLRRDRAILIACMAAIGALAVLHTVLGLGMSMPAAPGADPPTMAPMPGMDMSPAWTAGRALVIFAMWWAMMVAMMLPSAAPVVLLYAALLRAGRNAAAAPRLALISLAGYLAVWAGFSALATLLQWLLDLRGLVSPERYAVTSGVLGGVLLLAAGLYQFAPLKSACLGRCRNPGEVLARPRRPGAAGALGAGFAHGAYCLGCCWALMALLFVGGVMNPWWIAGLALLVAIEKLATHGALVARVAGAGLIVWGLWRTGVALFG